REQPKELTDWGVLGALVGKLAGSYWAVPVIEGLEVVPTSDEAKHMGAAMASFGSTPLFHMAGISPEAQTLADVGGDKLPAEDITKADLDALRAGSAARATRSTWSCSPPRSCPSSRCRPWRRFAPGRGSSRR
ncbi:MAG: aconitase X, partial [Rhodospirillales bacterium]